MPVYSYYIQKHWKAIDEWLFDNFDFGLIELAEVAETLLIQVTQ